MKRLLILNFHPAFHPPRSGGELRYWNLATRLAESFDVRMINPTYGDHAREDVEHAPRCVETRLPKTRAYNAWHRFFDRTAKFPECSALVATLAVKSHREYLGLAREQAASADIVMFSSPFMAAAWPKARPGQLLVYDSYNVEARLARETLGSGFWGRWGARRIARIEGRLARAADLVLVCSHEDGEEMCDVHRLDGSQIVVVPNGVDLNELRPPTAIERAAARRRLALTDERPSLLFIGSYHPPNIEALEYILREVAQQIPQVDILIAGKACHAVKDRAIPENVRLLGLVDEATRRDLFAGCDIALNPIFSGSGTNLKMLEFLAAGMLTITTPLGARGLDIDHGDQAMIVEPELFVRCVRDVLSDADRRARLRHMSRQHVEQHYSWNLIARQLRELLELKTSPRLLMLNDYPVTPVNSGGRVRLHAVARHLSETVAPVTVLTLTKESRGRHTVIGPRCEEINVPRSGAHNLLDKLLYAQTDRVAVDDVTALFARRLAPRFRRRLGRETQWASALLLDHCYMVQFARESRGKLPVVYESHNVEAVLKRAVLPQSLAGRRMLRAVERAERLAMQMAAFTTCVSDADRETFVREFGADGEKLVLAPNGVDCARRPQTPGAQRGRLRRAIGLGAEPAALFVGSGHPPNRDAIEFLLREVAPANPGVLFLVAGSVCGWFLGRPMADNVLLLGEIGEEVKEFLLQACDVALNPLFDGSGSSLKVPEYLSAGIPVISSEIGARGFATRDADALIVCPPGDIAARLRELACDTPRREALARKGRRLAEQRFDWSVTLRDFSERLLELLK